MPMPREEAESAAAEAEDLVEKTMTMSSDDLKSALQKGTGVFEAEQLAGKSEPAPREESKPAEEADSPAVEAAKPAEKTVPISREKISTDGDGENEPKGRLLPWEPATPAESSEATDK